MKFNNFNLFLQLNPIIGQTSASSMSPDSQTNIIGSSASSPYNDVCIYHICNTLLLFLPDLVILKEKEESLTTLINIVSWFVFNMLVNFVYIKYHLFYIKILLKQYIYTHIFHLIILFISIFRPSHHPLHIHHILVCSLPFHLFHQSKYIIIYIIIFYLKKKKLKQRVGGFENLHTKSVGLN